MDWGVFKRFFFGLGFLMPALMQIKVKILDLALFIPNRQMSSWTILGKNRCLQRQLYWGNAWLKGMKIIGQNKITKQV